MIQMLSIRGPIKSNRHGRFLEKEIKNDYLSTHATKRNFQAINMYVFPMADLTSFTRSEARNVCIVAFPEDSRA